MIYTERVESRFSLLMCFAIRQITLAYLKGLLKIFSFSIDLHFFHGEIDDTTSMSYSFYWSGAETHPVILRSSWLNA